MSLTVVDKKCRCGLSPCMMFADHILIGCRTCVNVVFSKHQEEQEMKKLLEQIENESKLKRTKSHIVKPVPLKATLSNDSFFEIKHKNWIEKHDVFTCPSTPIPDIPEPQEDESIGSSSTE